MIFVEDGIRHISSHCDCNCLGGVACIHRSSCGSRDGGRKLLTLTSCDHVERLVSGFLLLLPLWASYVRMPDPLPEATARPLSGERPDDGKRGGLRRALQFLAAGAGLAAVALLGARFVLGARRPHDETPLEGARRELRDLRRRIEVHPDSAE